MIGIIDYGMGNLGSVVNMLKKIGANATLIVRPEEIKGCEKLILPGVGSFDKAMQRINSSGLRDALDLAVKINKTPILGICLGMQLLTRGSEEGSEAGLGWVDAQTVRFPSDLQLRVPHMGWNYVSASPFQGMMNHNVSGDTRFYFVHSYYVKTDRSEMVSLMCNYGITFAAALESENIFGAQFHPEKSHRFGIQFLKNFADLKC